MILSRQSGGPSSYGPSTAAVFSGPSLAARHTAFCQQLKGAQSLGPGGPDSKPATRAGPSSISTAITGEDDLPFLPASPARTGLLSLSAVCDTGPTRDSPSAVSYRPIPHPMTRSRLPVSLAGTPSHVLQRKRPGSCSIRADNYACASSGSCLPGTAYLATCNYDSQQQEEDDDCLDDADSHLPNHYFSVARSSLATLDLDIHPKRLCIEPIQHSGAAIPPAQPPATATEPLSTASSLRAMTSTPPPAKRTKAEQAAEPTQLTKGKAATAKPAPQPGRWVDRDCNAALNMQRFGESRGRPQELCCLEISDARLRRMQVTGLTGLAVALIYLFQEKILYVPKIPGLVDSDPLTPERLGLQSEDISITTRDGVRLHAWLLGLAPWAQQHRRNRPVILFFQVLLVGLGLAASVCWASTGNGQQPAGAAVTHTVTVTWAAGP
ncbi:hypothetical protein QJQ45_011331 [Haematococcus lacustris]|nr:hypothetical protein QJQ45_011331 [Haematococcus lacustris]